MMRLPAALLVALAFACAAPPPAAQASGTTTSVKPVDRPPYYRGKLADQRPAAHLPVRVQLPPDLPEAWLPVEALARFADAMTEWLGEAGATRAMPPIEAGTNVVPPDVYLGCAMDSIGECEREPRENVLATTSGTRAWRDRIGDATGPLGVERVLVIQLGLAPHWIHQKNLAGAKEVRLGTEQSQRLPWLTSLDTPVWVVVVTGAVVDREGKVLKSGGEGLWAIRTPFGASVLGAERLMEEADVEFVRDELRPVWQSALAQLLTQLVGSAPINAGDPVKGGSR